MMIETLGCWLVIQGLLPIICLMCSILNAVLISQSCKHYISSMLSLLYLTERNIDKIISKPFFKECSHDACRLQDSLKRMHTQNIVLIEKYLSNLIYNNKIINQLSLYASSTYCKVNLYTFLPMQSTKEYSMRQMIIQKTERSRHIWFIGGE